MKCIIPEYNDSREPLQIVPESPSIKLLEKQKQKSHGSAVVTYADEPTSHKADPFTSEDDINRFVAYLLSQRKYANAALFIFGINTGYRCGDAIAFRVKDFYEKDGGFRKVLLIVEDKTGKARQVYVNKAIQAAIEMAIYFKRLNPNSYVFQTDGNRKAYIKGYRRSENGEIVDFITSGERLTLNGSSREVTPMTVTCVAKWIGKTAKQLGIVGHYSSHTMRKTFVEFISRGWNDDHNAVAACYALGHSDVRTTISHYMSIDPVRYREKCLTLNLGLKPLEEFLERKAAELSDRA